MSMCESGSWGEKMLLKLKKTLPQDRRTRATFYKMNKQNCCKKDTGLL